MPIDFRTAAPIENLRMRAKLMARLRSFFDTRGYIEVQTPVLSKFSIIDRHLDPILVPTQSPAAIEREHSKSSQHHWYMQTSPEQSMKRLLACGIGSIYQLGPVFRSGEFGLVHNPEFTMAEWYEVGADLSAGLETLELLLRELLGVSSTLRITFEEAFVTHTNLNVLSEPIESLATWCVANRLVEDLNWCDDWDDWVNLIFSERVQPKLGQDRLTIVTHFPASQAALAQVSSEDVRTAERYEAFYHGVELANGYHELADADVLLDRAEIANQQRKKDGKFEIPTVNPVLDAMRAGIPASCGCALGFDRVVMLACGATALSEVCAFTADRA